MVLDRLVYRYGGANLPSDQPHAFVYYLTIQNQSDRTVTLLGRKWLIEHDDGSRVVVEGDKIVGETPRLEPGQQFSYNSFHVCGCGGRARGSFHGVDEFGHPVFVRIPEFELVLPGG